MKDVAGPDALQRVLNISAVPGADGRSRLVRHRVSFPWSLGRGYPSALGPHRLTVIPQMAGAGLMAGDRFNHRISVMADAELEITAAGATLVHGRSVRDSAVSDWRLDVQDNAALLIAPEPHVLMSGADLLFRQNISVGADGIFLGADMIAIAPGVRDASFRAETNIKRPDGTSVFADVQSADEPLLGHLVALPGGCTCFATILIVAAPHLLGNVTAVVDQAVRALSRNVFGQFADLRGGAGIGLRITGNDAGAVRTAVRELYGLCAAELTRTREMGRRAGSGVT